MNEKIRIVLADDHDGQRTLTRTVIARQPDMEVIGEVGDGQAVVSMAQNLRPDVVVMDICMPQLDGLEATRRIRAQNGSPAVLILSCQDEPAILAAGQQAGAAGYLLKTVRSRQLIEAIRQVSAGQSLW